MIHIYHADEYDQVVQLELLQPHITIHPEQPNSVRKNGANRSCLSADLVTLCEAKFIEMVFIDGGGAYQHGRFETTCLNTLLLMSQR